MGERRAPRLIAPDRGPGRIVLVRHGQSVGNVADADARKRGAERLELDLRDADVPLSDTGERQAEGVGDVLGELNPDERPTLVVSSPYRRAADTAVRAVTRAGLDVPLVLDERLRERDLGLFDGLTGTGIQASYPEEARRRKRVGKFYYQPPSGESWCDVTLRVRSVLRDLHDGFDGANVWLFTHQAVIMCFRYVLEGLSEQEVLHLEATTDLVNCSLTSYRRTKEGMELVGYADTSAAERAPAPVTSEAPSAGRGDDVRV